MARGCADVGGCDASAANSGHGCHLCDVIASLPAKPAACGRVLDGGAVCELVADHPSWVACRGTKKGVPENATRDGDASRKGGQSLAFKKRHRVGPHR